MLMFKTRSYFVRTLLSLQGYHCNQYAETYLNVGQAMGNGMTELLNSNE